MRHSKNKQVSPNIYGFHAASEAWLNDEREIKALYLTEQASRGFEDTLSKGKKMRLSRPSPTIIEKHKLDKILPRGAVHQGVAITCSPLEESDIQDFIIKSHSQDKTVIAILDQVTDPHNVGAILRSASAFGLDGVVMQKKHAPILDGVLAKTACGAVDHIAVAQATNLSRAIKELQDEGFYVIGLDERGTHEIGKLDLKAANDKIKIAVVLGSEGDGIRRLIKESCDELTRLPTGGSIASLNVSNAAAVTFYALML